MSNSKFTCLLLIVLPFIGLSQSFDVDSDTLVLETSKARGTGLYKENIHWGLEVEEISDTSKWKDLIPKDIDSPILAYDYIDWTIFSYKNVLSGDSEGISKFIKENYPENIDTSNIPSWEENTLKVIVGKLNGRDIYIIDTNSNNDFRDDKVRTLVDFNESKMDIVKCYYHRYNGNEMVKDSSWVTITSQDEELRISVKHHMVSKINIGNQEYELQVINGPPYLRFGFESPLLGLSMIKGERKDSLLYGERLNINEYVKLENDYYRFDHISRDGRRIRLVKTPDVSHLIGNQEGFIAPNFEAVTIENDSVKLEEYKGERLLLVNLTGCYSPKMSYEYYKDLSEKYLSKLDMIVIDASAYTLQQNIDDLELKGKFVISKDNNSIKQNYREDFCSRVCYLIDREGRIEKKFEIMDWESALKNIEK